MSGTTHQAVGPLRRWPIGGWFGSLDTRTKVLSLLGGLVVWQILGTALELDWLPSCTTTLDTLGRLTRNGEIVHPLLSTLGSVVGGFLIAAVLGIVVGVLIGRFRRIEQALMVYVNLMLFIPSLIFAPIYSALFGTGEATRLVIVVHFAFFVIVINTSSGVRSVSPALLEMAESFGSGHLRTMRRVLLPGATLMMLAGLRLGLGLAVKGAIMAEMYLSAPGLGGVAHKYGGQFDASAVLAVSIVIAVLGLVMRGLLMLVEGRLTRWAD